MDNFEELKKAYEILGIPMGSKRSEIKTAYKKIISKNHPDRVPKEKRDEATKKTSEINAAYSLIWEIGHIEEPQDGKKQPEGKSNGKSSDKRDETTPQEGSSQTNEKIVKKVVLFWLAIPIAFIALIAVIYYVGSAVISLTENNPDSIMQQSQIPHDLPPLDISEISTTTVEIVETTIFTSQPPLPTRPPINVKVLVLNGSGVGGASGAVSNLLKPHGFTTLSPANGNKDNKSWVYYKPRFYSDALGIANILGVTPSLLISFPNTGISAPEGSHERINTADVVVFLGSDKEIYGY